MAGYSRNKNWKKGDGKRSTKPNTTDESLLESQSPVIKAFQQYRNELDAKHDKVERLVKMSRDITIESKRIIFLLHSNSRDKPMGPILDEAKTRLLKLIDTIFFNISKELEHKDPYQFIRSYRAGMQEFIEAYCFYNYLLCGELLVWEDLQKQLVYKNKEPTGDSSAISITEFAEKTVIDSPTEKTVIDSPAEKTVIDSPAEKTVIDSPAEKTVIDSPTEKTVIDSPAEKTVIDSPEPESEAHTSSTSVATDVKSTESAKEKDLKVVLTPVDYILGVEDLTGELMRHCINSVTTGNNDSVTKSCKFVRELYVQLMAFNRGLSKDFYRKLKVHKQSLKKMENACYLLHIRGSEVPKHVLASEVFKKGSTNVDEDEGFY